MLLPYWQFGGVQFAIQHRDRESKFTAAEHAHRRKTVFYRRTTRDPSPNRNKLKIKLLLFFLFFFSSVFVIRLGFPECFFFFVPFETFENFDACPRTTTETVNSMSPESQMFYKLLTLAGQTVERKISF